MLRGARKRASVLNTLRQSHLKGDIDRPLEKKFSIADQKKDLFEWIMLF
jgi:hypothetical protein